MNDSEIGVARGSSGHVGGIPSGHPNTGSQPAFPVYPMYQQQHPNAEDHRMVQSGAVPGYPGMQHSAGMYPPAYFPYGAPPNAMYSARDRGGEAPAGDAHGGQFYPYYPVQFPFAQMIPQQMSMMDGLQFGMMRKEEMMYPRESREAYQRFTPEKLSILEEFFTHHRYPSKSEKRKLCTELNTSYRRISNWFQNKRMKTKSRGDEQAGEALGSQDSTENDDDDNDDAVDSRSPPPPAHPPAQPTSSAVAGAASPAVLLPQLPTAVPAIPSNILSDIPSSIPGKVAGSGADVGLVAPGVSNGLLESQTKAEEEDDYNDAPREAEAKRRKIED